MTFTSVAFLLFLVVVCVGYYALPSRYRIPLLLAASGYFYMAFVPYYILVLLVLIVGDYVLARYIETASGAQRKTLLMTGIVANISLLFVFKYFNFFNENIGALARAIGWNYSIEALYLLLPLGLSFHIFQSLSYLVEVCRGKYPAEKKLGPYALYVLFFPQLVAGPIERPQHLLPQLKLSHPFRWGNIESGLRLIGWGFFKKLVIADQLAVSVNYVYGDVSQASGLSVMFAMVFFAFQLYADFSGYTDIARGSARLLGIDLVRNFEQPYFSRSIAEFWRRWHISLSTWFRDYFYYPLVYSARRKSVGWLYVCIVLTFLATGFWHGAGWTFLVMGALFGGYIVFGAVTKRWREALARAVGLTRVPRVHALLQVSSTFALVCVAWVFFRSPNLTSAFEFLGRLTTGWGMPLGYYAEAYVLQPFFTLGITRSVLLVHLGFAALLMCVEYRAQTRPIGVLLDAQPLWVKAFVYTSLFLTIVLFGSFSTVPFLYFQF